MRVARVAQLHRHGVPQVADLLQQCNVDLLAAAVEFRLHGFAGRWNGAQLGDAHRMRVIHGQNLAAAAVGCVLQASDEVFGAARCVWFYYRASHIRLLGNKENYRS